MQTKLLSDEEYKATFLAPMQNITGKDNDVIDIWPYVQSIPRDHLAGRKVYAHVVEYVYRSADDRFDHVLVMTQTQNVYLVVIVDHPQDIVYGHNLLNLNNEYGLLKKSECTGRFDIQQQTLPLRCPCCGFKTFKERGAFEICEVCYWEDDGQDEHDVDVARGGPNGSLSLRQARMNFRDFAACERRFVGAVRSPRSDELSQRMEPNSRVQRSARVGVHRDSNTTSRAR